MRENLNDEVKSKVKADDKIKKANVRENLDDEEKVKQKKSLKKRMQTLRENDKQRKDNIFDSVQDRSMVDPSIFETEAFKVIESEFKDVIKEGPTFICDICWKFEFRSNVIKLTETKYEQEIYAECHTGKSNWICKGCHRSMLNNKLPMQAQVNNLYLCDKIEELETLCAIELMLI
mgnify:FL=1